MHRSTAVKDSMEELILVDKSIEKHKEMLPGRFQRDSDNFENILTWFRSNNPFKSNVCLHSGLVDEKDIVICDRAE